MYATHCTIVIHSRAKKKYDYVKGQKSLVLNTKQCHKPYKFDLEVKVQGCIRIINVLDTSSHGDRPICQIWYANVKANRSYRLDMKIWQKPIKLTWRSKVNIQSGSWMYTTHHLMVIHPCAKYGRPMSKQKKVMGRTQKHVKNLINLTLRSKFKVVSGSWMYATHHLMVLHPCGKYGKPVSNHKKVMGRTRICTDRRTDRQTDRWTDRQIDRQTDRQSDFYIPPWTSFLGGIIKIQYYNHFRLMCMSVQGQKTSANFEHSTGNSDIHL